MSDMFCNQCQEASKNEACLTKGVCGKEKETSNLQDLLLVMSAALAAIVEETESYSVETDRWIVESLFSTVTNVNFDSAYFENRIRQSIQLRDSIRSDIRGEESIYGSLLAHAMDWTPASGESLEKKGAEFAVFHEQENPPLRSLKDLILYGLKGMAAYAHHAGVLGFEEPGIHSFLRQTLVEVYRGTLTADELFALTLETGKMGVRVMELLDRANTESYGHPEPGRVSLGVRNNPGILVSGHDLKDLEQLLMQTEGSGVDVYTHSEMLPAHFYPAFKKYTHFAGNYGGAWWQQKEDFLNFRGPILMTTNCLVKPHEEYADRLYTTGPVGFPGVKHLQTGSGGEKDFSEMIRLAKECEPPVELEQGEIPGGFARQTLLSSAPAILEAVNQGAIKKFVVMAGCDARQTSRSYYTDFARELPDDVIILTAGCAKYRYHKEVTGEIGGIPRVVDAGQCNDSYSLAVTALKLAEVLGVDVNQLPITYNIAWYEQKAVIVLLALLSLGVKNIKLGPTLPPFLSQEIVSVLVEQFGLSAISDPESDRKELVGASA